jgi:Rieske Fe-S protein
MRLASFRLDRRKVLAATGFTVFAAVVAACSSSDKKPADSTSSGSTPTAAGTAGNTATTSAAAPKVITTTAEVPVGSGVILEQDEIVVTQPTAGKFTGLSAICPHQGCTVNKIADGTIDCPCHGSKFNLDGTVAHGPADKPLQAENVTVQGDSIVLG